jgi:Protein of unknown function (DUF3823) N-terminal domain/Domain of unknown function (DUF3823_C)
MRYKLLFSILILSVVLGSCKKDNLKAPESTITGSIVFNKLPLGVRSNGVQVELWQHGYQLFSKIPVYVKQDGTFSAKVFDGSYKLTLLKGNGPWADNTDSIDVVVSGSKQVDITVDPFFIINNATFQRTGSTITGTFGVQKVNATKALELVRIYVGQTVITDQTNNAGTAQKLAAAVDITQPVTLNVNVPGSLAAKDYVFVRIGVKAAGVGELLYSAPQKISLK